MTAKKKTTDISSMLKTAERASNVQRPQVEIRSEVEHKAPAKRVSASMDAELHHRLKVLAVSRGIKVLELTDEAISSYLDAAQDR